MKNVLVILGRLTTVSQPLRLQSFECVLSLNSEIKKRNLDCFKVLYQTLKDHEPHRDVSNMKHECKRTAFGVLWSVCVTGKMLRLISLNRL